MALYSEALLKINGIRNWAYASYSQTINDNRVVVFDEISNTIIQGIRDANYIIWVAVAWFTDREIFNELMLRKQDGISIRIITSDEETNNRYVQNVVETLLKEMENMGHL